MSVPDALTFLQSVAGYAQAQDGGSPSKPVRLATVDPAYTGAPALPQVTFDGEDTLSGKTYAYSYPVGPGDRVALLPVGTTYLIIGAIGRTLPQMRAALGADNAANLTTGTLPVARLNPTIVAGVVGITPAANAPTMGTWNYGRTLTGTVRVQATAQTSVPGTVQEVSVAVRGAASCDVYLFRTNTQFTNIYCLATGGLG